MVVRPDSPSPATTSTAQQPFGTTDETLRDTCAQIYDRLGRLEASLQRTEGFVADKPWDVATIAYRRLERVEQTMRLMQRSLDDSTMPEMCVNIERQIRQTRVAVERTEKMLTRTEGVLADWRRQLSAAIQPAQRPVAVAPAAQSHAIHLVVPPRWRPRLVVPVVALVMIVMMAALISTSRGSSPKRTPVRVTTRQIAAPLPRPVAVAFREPAVATPAVNAAFSDRVNAIAVPKPQSPGRVPAAIASGSEVFVGAVSITSVPSGAAVSINGKAAGVTPLRLPRQRAGSVAVQIVQDGFERWSAAVRVPADQLTQVTAKLRPIVQ